MKHTTGYVRPRRTAAPKKKVRLDLKRRPPPIPEEEWGTGQKSHFWQWVGLVALFHLIVIGLVFFLYENGSSPKPPEQFISLLPEGNLVKGTPGAQKAPKIGPTTTAAVVHHVSTPTTPPVTHVKPKPPTPKPVILKPDALTSVALDKPTPKPPKVKVDLTLADGPTPDKPAIKPKPHHKKPAPKPTQDTDEDQNETAASSESTGLSKEQIAEKLGEKLDAAGSKDAVNLGTSGSTNSHASPFADFYVMIKQQIDDQWQTPNVATETATNPVVLIHVEKDGRVPPDMVRLVKSSGIAAYDDSAVETAKNLGYLHEPLPDGCPPDISIDFKPDR
jgi:outer membrane biosynthesis protein TonB